MLSFATVRIPLQPFLLPLKSAAWRRGTSPHVNRIRCLRFHSQYLMRNQNNKFGVCLVSTVNNCSKSAFHPRGLGLTRIRIFAAPAVEELTDENEDDEDDDGDSEGEEEEDSGCEEEEKLAKSILLNSPPPSTDKLQFGAVVRVFCTHLEPRNEEPWSWGRCYNSRSSGLIIPGRKVVITNAHCVEHHTYVKLQKCGSSKKYTAVVLTIGTECDCALLTVHDDQFWDGVPEVEFSEILKSHQAINVVGFPGGRDTPSVTRGIMKWIGVVQYLQSSMKLPCIQVNATVNPGNSGGPVFDDDGKCVGLAFQGGFLKNDVIPTKVVMHFILDYEKNQAYTGFPYLGIRWLQMKDPVLRETMEMKPDQTGILIRSIEPTSLECEVLKSSDVLLSINGVKIGNDGTVPLVNGDRANFSYMVSQKYCGDTIRVEVLRGTNVLELDIQVANHKRSILANIKNKPVSYYIIGGLVFTNLSDTYLSKQYGKRYESTSPMGMLKKLAQTLTSAERQLVILSKILSADINNAYEAFSNLEIQAFNGRTVESLWSMAEMVDNCREEFLKFEFENTQIVLKTDEAKASSPELLFKYGIRSDRSEDLKMDKKPNNVALTD